MPKHKPHLRIKCPKCGHTFTHGAPVAQVGNPAIYILILFTILAAAAYACTYIF